MTLCKLALILAVSHLPVNGPRRFWRIGCPSMQQLSMKGESRPLRSISSSRALIGTLQIVCSRSCSHFISLSATYLRNRILGALRSSEDPAIREVAHKVPDDIIFANPTIQWLVGVLASLVAGDSTYSSRTLGDLMEDLIRKYSANLPNFAGKADFSSSQPMVVGLFA